MILQLYTLFIHVYGFLIRLAAVRSKQAKQWVNGRADWRNNYARQLRDCQQPIWIHCASLGEFEQGRPLIEKLRTNYPNKPIVLTFFSPSGFEVRKEYEQVDHVLYLPLDTKQNAIDFVELLNPSLVLFVKYEFWFNYLSILHNRKIPVVYFSTIFRENHFLLKWPGKLFLPLLKSCQKIFVQDEDSLHRLNQFQFPNVSLAFDTRFDRVWNTAQTAKEDNVLQEFKGNRKLLMLGSSWSLDIDALVCLLPDFDFKNWCIAIAPHHIDTASLDELTCQLVNLEKKQFYTDFNAQVKSDILIINSMGKLSALYKMADVVFVGGGFGKAVHNVLEPAVFAKPIICGPQIHKFKEVIDLASVNGISVLNQTGDLKSTWMKIGNDVSIRNSMGNANFEYVKSRLGGADTIFNYLRTFF